MVARRVALALLATRAVRAAAGVPSASPRQLRGASRVPAATTTSRAADVRSLREDAIEVDAIEVDATRSAALYAADGASGAEDDATSAEAAVEEDATAPVAGGAAVPPSAADATAAAKDAVAEDNAEGNVTAPTGPALEATEEDVATRVEEGVAELPSDATATEEVTPAVDDTEEDLPIPVDRDAAEVPSSVTTVEEDISAAQNVEEDTATVEIPADCLELLIASQNEDGKMKKDNYFVFSDGISNGYYTYHNMTSYKDLPMENKFGYVALTCRCLYDGKGDCCLGDRAAIDLLGLTEDLDAMSTYMQRYMLDICAVTAKAIGENVLPSPMQVPSTMPIATSLPVPGPSASRTVDLTTSPTVARKEDVPSHEQVLRFSTQI